MSLRWTRRTVQINLGSPESPFEAGVVTRSRQFLWKASKSSIKPFLRYSKHWSVAFQTLALLLASFALLVYMLVDPSDDSETWAQEILTSSVPTAFPRDSSRKHEVLSPILLRTTNQIIGPTQQKSAQIPLDKGYKAGLNPNETVQGMGNLTTMISSERIDPKISLEITSSRDVELYLDPSKKKTEPSVCRIYGGCVDTSGGLIFDSSMKVYSRALQRCGLTNAKFTNKLLHKSGNMADKDLFTNQLRYHMPHLVSDVLSLSYAMSVVTGKYPLTTQLPGTARTIRPVAIAQSRLRKLDPNSWTPRLISMLPFQTQINTSEELFPMPHVNPVCFRSIVSFSSQVYWQVTRGRFLDNNVLFEQATAWSRLPKAPGRSGYVLSSEHTRECKPTVMVLNRPESEARTISNIEEIRKTFDELKQTSQFTAVRGAAFRVEYMNQSFTKQLELMQEADIVLASHGAALANLIFGRIGTPVIEILPFAYYADLFERIANVMSLPYESVVAEPDDEKFFNCLEKKNIDPESGGATLNITAWNNFKAQWGAASTAYKLQNDRRVLHLQNRDFDFEYTGLESIRMCARNQHLKVEAASLAKKLLTLASQACNRQMLRNGSNDAG